MGEAMNLGDILKKVGTSIIRDAVPGGGAILELVNTFLPDDKKLPKDATGDQVKNAVQALPPEQQAALMLKELDVEIEEVRSWTNIQEALAKADEAGASTRPWIAKLMACGVFIAVMTFVATLAFAVVSKDNETLKELSQSWELILAILATPTALLRAYFGMRTEEKKARYGVALGSAPVSKQGIVESIIRRN